MDSSYAGLGHHQRNLPRYNNNNNRTSGGKCCLKCLCCCCCFWFILIILLSSIAALAYRLANPQMPSYNVDHFEVRAFDVQPDYTLDADITATVRAWNPNEHISLEYGETSSVVVLYKGSVLCSGKLPVCHQPARNVTLMNIVLKGKSKIGPSLQQNFMIDKTIGKIPLLIKVKAPITVVLKKFPVREFVAYVNCSLVVDNLSKDKEPKILSSQYNYDVGF